MSSPSASTPAPAAPVSTAVKSLVKQPAFMITFVLLLAGAIGLNGATNMMRLHFRKLPVDLQKDLKDLPADLGPWRQVNIDMPLQHDIQEVLGTEKYIFRDFVNTAVVPPARMALFEGKDYIERRALLYGRHNARDENNQPLPDVRGVMEDYPASVMSLSVTYYTGLVDTVAHIPDRCFVADGYRPTDYVFPRWKLPGFAVDREGWRLDASGHPVNSPSSAAGTDEGLPVRYIRFEDQDTSRRIMPKNVTYFFQVNGQYDSNPLGVRTKLQNLWEPYGYYAKVELMTLLADQNKSEQIMQDFLQYSMPELEECLPDWGKVKAAKAR